VTIAINPGAPFGGELALVAMQKARKPRVRVHSDRRAQHSSLVHAAD
jgi:hypothetical protein